MPLPQSRTPSPARGLCLRARTPLALICTRIVTRVGPKLPCGNLGYNGTVCPSNCLGFRKNEQATDAGRRKHIATVSEPVRRVRTMVCCMTRVPIRAETAGSAPGAVVFSLPDACSQAVLPTQPVPSLQEHFQRLQPQGTAHPIGIRAIFCAVVL
jgi:hypothetical protein